MTETIGFSVDGCVDPVSEDRVDDREIISGASSCEQLQHHCHHSPDIPRYRIHLDELIHQLELNYLLAAKTHYLIAVGPASFKRMLAIHVLIVASQSTVTVISYSYNAQ